MGGIVDEDALYEALKCGRIAGAAIELFFPRSRLPLGTSLPTLDNVILAPHSIAWTNELFRDIGQMACKGMADLSMGRTPKGVVNPKVFDRPGFRAKWQKFRIDHTTDGKAVKQQ